MSDKPLLPHDLEKAGFDPAESHTSTEASFNGLRLGGGSYLAQTRERVHNLSRAKKVLFGVLSVWALGTLIKNALHGLHGDDQHGIHGGHMDQEIYDASQWVDEESPAVTTFIGYSNPDVYYTTDGSTVYIANATYELAEQHHRQITVRVGDGVKAGVVISKEDVESAQLVVESVLEGDLLREDVKVISGQRDNVLELNAVRGDHIVHLVLPLRAHRVPRLHLTSSNPSIQLHSSASDLEFSHLSIESENDIKLDHIIAKDVHIETHSGKVSGTFNVSKAIVFKTVTGDIDATVNVHPLGPPHGDHHDHTGEGRPPHKKPEGDGDEEGFPHGHHEEDSDEDEQDGHHRHHHGKHGGKHHDEKRSHHGEERGCSGGGGVLGKLRSLFGFGGAEDYRKHGRGDEPRGPPSHGKHPHDPPHGDHPPPPPPHGDHSPPPPHGDHPPPPHGDHPPPPPHGDHPPPPPHGPHGPPPPPPHHGHGHEHHHGPPAIFIGAFTTTGIISLTIHQPDHVSTLTKAYSHTGNVTVNGSEKFKGYFEVGTHVGNVSIATSGEKEIEVLKEVVTVTGGFVEGFVRSRGNDTEGHERPTHGQEGEDDLEEWAEDEGEFEVIDDDREKSGEEVENVERGQHHHHDEPPHKGPGGPPPPHKGPGGPPPPHKGPGGPPPPPHKGPGGPPPPHKGPGGPPPPPHKGPHGPDGPHTHPRPPPPGFSELFAKTDVGDVKVTL